MIKEEAVLQAKHYRNAYFRSSCKIVFFMHLTKSISQKFVDVTMDVSKLTQYSLLTNCNTNQCMY